MPIEIPIFDRSRKYGYIYWKNAMDESVKKFLGDRQSIDVWFENSLLGKKNIDWKNRRISIGYKQSRKISESAKLFIITYHGDELKVICR